MRDRLFLLLMPVMFAERISHIDLYNLSKYATTNIDTGTSFIGMDLVECSILVRIKAYSVFPLSAVAKC